MVLFGKATKVSLQRRGKLFVQSRSLVDHKWCDVNERCRRTRLAPSLLTELVILKRHGSLAQNLRSAAVRPLRVGGVALLPVQLVRFPLRNLSTHPTRLHNRLTLYIQT